MENNDNIVKQLDKDIQELQEKIEGLKIARRHFAEKKSQTISLNGTLPKVSLSHNGNDKFAPTVRNIILNYDQWFTTNEIFEMLKENFPDKVSTIKKAKAFKNNISFVLSESKRNNLGITSVGSSKKNYHWGKNEWVEKGKVKPEFAFNLKNKKGTESLFL